MVGANVQALRDNKTVATLAWLVRILSCGQMSSPRDHLLHFPYPKAPVPGFAGELITITNYSGSLRNHLKELIAKMGGTFTPDMTPDNTVCVALSLKGDKVTKAREWNIPIVNHIWLESCFATWKKQNLAQRQFITFPGVAELEAVVGQASVAESSLLQWLEREDEPAPAPSQPSPGADTDESAVDAYDGEAADTVDARTDAAHARVNSKAPRDSGSPDASTPRTRQETPDVRARNEIVDVTIDADTTQAECDEASVQHKLLPLEHEAHGETSETRMSPRTAQMTPRTPRTREKRKHETPTRTPLSSRKRRTDATPCIATTSVELTDAEEETLVALGIARTEHIAEATHLVAQSLTRTEKMLCAIASGRVQIVSHAWIAAMVKQKQILGSCAALL